MPENDKILPDPCRLPSLRSRELDSLDSSLLLLGLPPSLAELAVVQLHFTMDSEADVSLLETIIVAVKLRITFSLNRDVDGEGMDDDEFRCFVAETQIWETVEGAAWAWEQLERAPRLRYLDWDVLFDPLTSSSQTVIRLPPKLEEFSYSLGGFGAPQQCEKLFCAARHVKKLNICVFRKDRLSELLSFPNLTFEINYLLADWEHIISNIALSPTADLWPRIVKLGLIFPDPMSSDFQTEPEWSWLRHFSKLRCLVLCAVHVSLLADLVPELPPNVTELDLNGPVFGSSDERYKALAVLKKSKVGKVRILVPGPSLKLADREDWIVPGINIKWEIRPELEE